MTPSHSSGTTVQHTAGPEDGRGELFRDGTFLSWVRYTLVAIENDPAPADGEFSSRPIYTGVLRFSASARDISQQLWSSETRFELKTANGERLECEAAQPLATSGLRWIVRLR
jgi:hypothetical protein